MIIGMFDGPSCFRWANQKSLVYYSSKFLILFIEQMLFDFTRDNNGLVTWQFMKNICSYFVIDSYIFVDVAPTWRIFSLGSSSVLAPITCRSHEIPSYEYSVDIPATSSETRPTRI